MHNLSTVGFVHFSQVKSKTLSQVNLHKNLSWLFLRCSQRNMVKESLSFQEGREKNILLKRENLLVAPFSIFSLNTEGFEEISRE